MQDINEECVVLEEVISLETAAVTDPKVRKKFAVVGCGGRGRQEGSYTNVFNEFNTLTLMYTILPLFHY